MKQFSIVFILLGLSYITYGQEELLSLQQAIEIGLKNNYSIIIAQNESQIAENNVSPGNAGMLPQVDFGLTQTNSYLNTNQKFSSGSEVNRSNASSHGINATVALDWTVFDGMKMFVTYDKLKEFKAIGDLNLKLSVENTVSDIISGYYDIIQQKALLDVASNSKDISEVKLNIAKTKYRIGSSSKVEYLQAQVDYNASLSAFKKQKIKIETAKVHLNKILARSVTTSFDVNDSIEINYNPTYEDLKSQAEQENITLMLAQRNIGITDLTIRQLQAQRFPNLALNGSYNYSNSTSQASFVLSNQTNGFNYGFTLSYNLFNGFQLNRSISNAKIDLENSKLNFLNVETEMNANLINAFQVYQDNLDLLKLEQDNSKLAKENLDLTLEQYKVGTIDELKLKEAQQSYIDAETRLVSAKYDTKIAETNLKKLTGQLIPKSFK